MLLTAVSTAGISRWVHPSLFFLSCLFVLVFLFIYLFISFAVILFGLVLACWVFFFLLRGEFHLFCACFGLVVFLIERFSVMEPMSCAPHS